MAAETYHVKPKIITMTKVIVTWLLAAIAVGSAVVVASVLKSENSIIAVVFVSGLAIAAATAISFRWAEQHPQPTVDE